MEKIVQISNREYDRLVETSNLNKEQIEARALEMYNERGVVGLHIALRLRESTHWANGNYKLKFDPIVFKSDYLENCESFAEITTDEEKTLIDNAKHLMNSLFYEKFGEQTEDIVYLKNLRVSMEKEQNILRAVTFTGWGLAIAIMLFMFLFT